MEIWDGYNRDGTLAHIDLIRGEVIPQGLYHMVSDILVQHIDGDFLLMQRDLSKEKYAGYYEATAGGSALKGEDKLTCAKRELLEETGIVAKDLQELYQRISKDTIHNMYFCLTDCKKDSIVLQKGETISYKWVSEKEFIEFIHSPDMITHQKERYMDYFIERGFAKRE